MKSRKFLVTAIVGMLGIRPTIAAIEAGKENDCSGKQRNVSDGRTYHYAAGSRVCSVRILPVDSEHSAIFQSLQGE